MAKCGAKPKFTSRAEAEAEPARAANVSMMLHTKQKAFVSSNKIYRGFCSGIGAGKSICGAYDLCIKSKPECLYAIVGPTYRMLSDASMRAFIEVATKLGLWNADKYRKTDNIAMLNNGAEVLFRSGDVPGSLRGPTLSGCWMDECQDTSEEVFNVMIGRLRQGGKQGWLCLAGEEMIFDPVLGRSRRLDEINEDFHVYSVDTKTDARVIAKASRPFPKGVGHLYRFHLSNGQSFVAPMRHRVLAHVSHDAEAGGRPRMGNTPSHGQCERSTNQAQCTDAEAGSSRAWLPLSKCVATPPTCDMRASLASDLGCGLDCLRTDAGSQCDCRACCHLCDERPLHAPERAQDAPPSPADALIRSLSDWRADDLYAGAFGSRLTSEHHPSIGHIESPPTREVASESHASYTPSGPVGCLCQDVRQSLDTSDPLAHTTPASLPLASLCASPLYIISWEYVRTDWYYDFTVSLYHNYEHCQVVHHNSATFTPAGKDHWTYRVFGDETNPNVTLVRCSTKDNPFNPPEYYENLLFQYGRGEGGMLRARQELEGEFVCVEGAEWGPELFGPDIWYDEFYPDSAVVRAVALDSSRGIGGKSGDFSAFAKVTYYKNLLWVEFDMDNRRNSSEMAATAVEIQREFRADYFGVELEFGGTVLADDLQNRADAQNVLMPLVLVPTAGIPKEVRIRRLTPYLSRKMIRFKNNEQTRLAVQQFESFPHAQHDDACFVAGTMISTKRGPVPIERISVGEFVLTRRGYCRVTEAGCTGLKPVVEITTLNGEVLAGTPNHPVFNGVDFTPLATTKELWSCQKSILPENPKRSYSTESPSGDTQPPGDGRTECIIPRTLTAELCSSLSTSTERSIRPDFVPHYANKGSRQKRSVLRRSRVVKRYAREAPEKVFNLSVDGPGEYFANGFLVHNCDALEMALRIINESGMV